MNTQQDLPRLFDDPAFNNLPLHSKCLCGQLLPAIDITRRDYSGVVNYTLTLCRDCTTNFADFSRIVCLKCKSLQGFLKPYKAPDGFVYESKKHYHIFGCPRCDSSITATPVLEHERFRAERLGPSKPDQDLVQEIEQKSLQGMREIDRLKSSLKL